MIAIQPHRITALNYESGSILVNEDGQKFRLTRNTKAVVLMEPYEGKRPPSHFVFMGEVPGESAELPGTVD
jgi:hypothetical protein